MTQDRAIALLGQLERRARAHAAPLPSGPAVAPRWQGMAFQVGGIRLVASLDEIAEVVAMPRITLVPRTKAWLLGIANVRGRLVSIVDLHRFFGLVPTQPGGRWRVLVVESDERVAGLVVEQLLGMQQFEERAVEPIAEPALGELGRYVSRSFRQDGFSYHEASLRAMLRDARFLDVAESSGPALQGQPKGTVGISEGHE